MKEFILSCDERFSNSLDRLEMPRTILDQESVREWLAEASPFNPGFCVAVKRLVLSEGLDGVGDFATVPELDMVSPTPKHPAISSVIDVLIWGWQRVYEAMCSLLTECLPIRTRLERLRGSIDSMAVDQLGSPSGDPPDSPADGTSTTTTDPDVPMADAVGNHSPLCGKPC